MSILNNAIIVEKKVIGWEREKRIFAKNAIALGSLSNAAKEKHSSDFLSES